MADNTSSVNRRQEIYDKIRQSSKDEYILSEMKRLGFWDENVDKPHVAEELIKQESALVKELQALFAKQYRLKNKEAYLKELRKERLIESNRKRKEKKEAQKQEKLRKAKEWEEFKKKEIIFLGERFSAGLNNKEFDFERAAKNKIPQIKTVEELAKLLGTTVNELRFLSFDRKTAQISHYKRFFIQKKSGGNRLISAPMPRLKKIQYEILNTILYKIAIRPHAHGFVPQKSIITNAKNHVGQDIVINMDLKNFFPSITYERVKGVFRSLGYSEQIAIILALICTEPEVSEVELDDNTYFLNKSRRYLPQGAPTSPALTNIICRKLDSRMYGLASHFKFNYSRYADDITFSASGEQVSQKHKLLSCAKRIIQDESFRFHPEKLRIMHKGRRQEVTGIVVNKKMNVNKRKVKNLKAVLFQIEKDGPENKHWEGKKGTSMLNAIHGYAEFVKSVQPQVGRPLAKQASLLLKKYSTKKETHSKKDVLSQLSTKLRKLFGK